MSNKVYSEWGGKGSIPQSHINSLVNTVFWCPHTSAMILFYFLARKSRFSQKKLNSFQRSHRAKESNVNYLNWGPGSETVSATLILRLSDIISLNSQKSLDSLIDGNLYHTSQNFLPPSILTQAQCAGRWRSPRQQQPLKLRGPWLTKYQTQALVCFISWTRSCHYKWTLCHNSTDTPCKLAETG